MTDIDFVTVSIGGETQSDVLMREVYCVLGMPVDVIEMPALLKRIEIAASTRTPLFISTPNLNFLTNCRFNRIFRESLLFSDLCPADGMPIVWISRILGIPIESRVSGSDFFEALMGERGSARPLKVFLFGGAEGVAARACNAINSTNGGLQCVGTIYPHFGTVEDMSQDSFIEEINSSGADFLITSLGAEKGQLWLLRNHNRLQIPVRAHLGAVINFQAGVLRRAPPIVRRWGLEWLWRIKEEPHLWRRYWRDGSALLSLLLIYVLPLAVRLRLQRLGYDHQNLGFLVRQVEDHESITLSLCGAATVSYVGEALSFFSNAVKKKKNVIIDLAHTRAIDARFLGLLLMLRKRLREHEATLTFTAATSRMEKLFRLNGAGFLLGDD